jgi:hypothetical protein
MSGIAPNQNAFKFKIAPHKQKSIVIYCFGKVALYLSTPKHNSALSIVRIEIQKKQRSKLDGPGKNIVQIGLGNDDSDANI